MATPLVAQITTNTSHIRELEAAVAELKARCEQRDQENARLIAELEATAQNLTAMWRLVAGPDPITEEAMAAAVGARSASMGHLETSRSAADSTLQLPSSPANQWSTPQASPVTSPPAHSFASQPTSTPSRGSQLHAEEQHVRPEPPPSAQPQPPPQPQQQPHPEPQPVQPVARAAGEQPVPSPQPQPQAQTQPQPQAQAHSASSAASAAPQLSASRTPDVDFTGVWALSQSVKFKEYLEATGVPWAKRQVAIKLKPVQEWVQVDPDVWEFSMQTPIGKKVETLIVGGTTEDEIDGQPVLKETFWEGEVLVTHCRPRDRKRTDVKLTEFRRHLDKRSDKMVLEIVTGDARCSRIFERQRAAK